MAKDFLAGGVQKYLGGDDSDVEPAEELDVLVYIKQAQLKLPGVHFPNGLEHLLHLAADGAEFAGELIDGRAGLGRCRTLTPGGEDLPE